MLLLMLLGSFGSFGEAYCRRRFSNATFKAVPELPGDKSSSPELCDAVSHANQFCGRKDSGPELGTSADLSCQVSKFHKALSSELWIAWQSWQWHVVRCLAIKLYQINKAVFASAMWCHVPFASWKDLYRSPRKLVEDRLHSRGRWKSSGGQLLWGVCSPHCFSVLHPFASFAHHILNIHLKHCCHAQLCHTHTHNIVTHTHPYTHTTLSRQAWYLWLWACWGGPAWSDVTPAAFCCSCVTGTICVAGDGLLFRGCAWHASPWRRGILCGRRCTSCRWTKQWSTCCVASTAQHCHTNCNTNIHTHKKNTTASRTTFSHMTQRCHTPHCHAPHWYTNHISHTRLSHTTLSHTHSIATHTHTTLINFVSLCIRTHTLHPWITNEQTTKWKTRSPKPQAIAKTARAPHYKF